jgi:Spy/CpxP family protein refolding chaperone
VEGRAVAGKPPEYRVTGRVIRRLLRQVNTQLSALKIILMKSKIRLLPYFCVLVLAGAPFANAADDGTINVVPPESATAPARKGHDGKRMQGALEHRLQELDQNLQLTSEQKQKIKDVWAKQAEELKDLSPEERRTKGRNALMATRTEIRGLLTPEQQAKFDRMKHDDGRPGKGLRKDREKKVP